MVWLKRRRVGGAFISGVEGVYRGWVIFVYGCVGWCWGGGCEGVRRSGV